MEIKAKSCINYNIDSIDSRFLIMCSYRFVFYFYVFIYFYLATTNTGDGVNHVGSNFNYPLQKKHRHSTPYLFRIHPAGKRRSTRYYKIYPKVTRQSKDEDSPSSYSVLHPGNNIHDAKNEKGDIPQEMPTAWELSQIEASTTAATASIKVENTTYVEKNTLLKSSKSKNSTVMLSEVESLLSKALNKVRILHRVHQNNASKVSSVENNANTTQLSNKSWDNWTAWSQCNVTCGKGRQIRWRHCVLRTCLVADSEMEEKSCQLPACPPGKFLGLF